jgi:hypothetical protein
VLKSCAKGITLDVPKPKERYRAVATWGKERAVLEKDGSFMDVLREAQDKFRGASIQITCLTGK